MPRVRQEQEMPAALASPDTAGAPDVTVVPQDDMPALGKKGLRVTPHISKGWA